MAFEHHPGIAESSRYISQGMQPVGLYLLWRRAQQSRRFAGVRSDHAYGVFGNRVQRQPVQRASVHHDRREGITPQMPRERLHLVGHVSRRQPRAHQDCVVRVERFALRQPRRNHHRLQLRRNGVINRFQGVERD